MNSTSNFLSKKTVFLADDEYVNLQCFREVLSDAGYEVRTATNGKLALRSIQEAPPDLVVLDVQMPGMNGYQVYQSLQLDEKTRHIPVIFMSGMDKGANTTENVAIDKVDYLSKPFNLKDLLTHVENVLTNQ